MQSIGIGSKTSTGGEVVEGNNGILMNGLVATSVGQKATCPKCKKGWGYIVAVGPRSINLPAGPAARAGDYVDCGCPEGDNVLLGEGSVFIGAGSSAAHSASARNLGVNNVAAKSPLASTQTSLTSQAQAAANALNEQITSTSCAIGESLNTQQDAEFKVTDIPTVMRTKLHWPKSAQLMELWFSMPARAMLDDEKKNNIKPNQFPATYIERNLFTWQWLRQFPQVQEKRQLLEQRLSNENAKDRLRDILAQQLPKQPPFALGQSYFISHSANPITLHSLWQFQVAKVRYKFNQVDDLYGSLGNFALYAALTKAKITAISASAYSTIYQGDILEAGLYMKDTYDFLGGQYLGRWDFNGMGITLMAGASNLINSVDEEFEWRLPAWFPALGVVQAFGNQDFNDYRAHSGKGGDLLIFSDVERVPMQLTVQVEVIK